MSEFLQTTNQENIYICFRKYVAVFTSYQCSSVFKTLLRAYGGWGRNRDWGANYNLERKMCVLSFPAFYTFLPLSLFCVSISRHKHTEHIDLPRGRHSSLGLCLNLSALPSALLKKKTYIFYIKGGIINLLFPDESLAWWDAKERKIVPGWPHTTSK